VLAQEFELIRGNVEIAPDHGGCWFSLLVHFVVVQLWVVYIYLQLWSMLKIARSPARQ
jgi:hypothetical protein